MSQIKEHNIKVENKEVERSARYSRFTYVPYIECSCGYKEYFDHMSNKDTVILAHKIDVISESLGIKFNKIP